MHPSIVRRRSSTVRWILSLLSPEPTTTGLPSVSTKATNGSESAEFAKVSTFFRSVMDDRNLGSGYHRPWGRSSRESQTPVQESPTAKGTRRLKSSCSKTERNPNDTLLAGGGCPDVAEEGRAPMLCSIRTCRNRKTPPAGGAEQTGGGVAAKSGGGWGNCETPSPWRGLLPIGCSCLCPRPAAPQPGRGGARGLRLRLVEVRPGYSQVPSDLVESSCGQVTVAVPGDDRPPPVGGVYPHFMGPIGLAPESATQGL